MLLIAATLLAYLPAWHAGFIWDDNDYVINNTTLRSLGGLWRIWFELRALPQYYPLVHSTFWVEYHLWGLNPAGFHAVNLALHATAAILLWRVLTRLSVPGAWLAAAIFALHPVAVESVAWITERKNVLSAVFYFAAALAYLRFLEPADLPKPRRRFHYLAALGLFVAALLSKTVTCSLPAALLLVIWWQKGRLRRNDVLPLAPFFAVGLGLGLLTAWVEKHHVGAQGMEWTLTLGQRFLIAGRALWFYAGKLVWPADLIFSYPRWDVKTDVWWQWLFPVTAIGAVAALWLARNRIGRGPLVAVLFFAGTLGPALGFINVYPMRYSFVADHFQYLASVGLIVLAAASLKRARPFLYPAWCAGLLLALGLLTWRQCGMYANLETLWRTTIARNPGSWLAHNNLGYVYFQAGRLDDAMAQYKEALKINPNFSEAHNDLGQALLQSGDVDGAIAQFQKTLDLDPEFKDAEVNLGAALVQKGEAKEAVPHFQKVLKTDPENLGARNNLGNALLQMGRTEEAIRCYQAALEIDPASLDTCLNLGGALYQAGRPAEAIDYFQKALAINPSLSVAQYDIGTVLIANGRAAEAVVHFQKAVQIKPDYAEAYNSLGSALSRTGRQAEAMDQYRNALKIQPRYTAAQINLAWILATCPDAALRNGSEAVSLARQANQSSGGGDLIILRTLAAAYAEAGQFPQAITTVQQALRLAGEANAAVLVERLQRQLQHYQAGLPFRDDSLTNAPAPPGVP